MVGPDGKYLGLIPTPEGIISLAFSGPRKKTLYAVIYAPPSGNPPMRHDKIITIPTIAQGYKGRAK